MSNFIIFKSHWLKNGKVGLLCVNWVVSVNQMRLSALPGDQPIISISQTVVLCFLAPLRCSILNMPITDGPCGHPKTSLYGAWSQGILERGVCGEGRGWVFNSISVRAFLFFFFFPTLWLYKSKGKKDSPIYYIHFNHDLCVLGLTRLIFTSPKFQELIFLSTD